MYCAKTVKRKSVGIFLFMLMLSNSSLALEIFTHDGHQHDSASTAAAMQDANLHSGTPDSLTVMPSMDHGNGDCVCDDICCVGLIEFSSANSDAIHSGIADANLFRDNLYQSIALSLLLHPPTA